MRYSLSSTTSTFTQETLMDYLELLFAERVHRLAASQLREEWEDMADSAPEESWAEVVQAWEVANPFSKFVREAYEEIADVAQQIRAIRSASPPAQ